MYLIVVSLCLFGCALIAFAKPNEKIHPSDDISLREMLFELKSLVVKQNERILELERQNGKQSDEINDLRTMIQTHEVKLFHLVKRCENSVRTLTGPRPKKSMSEQPSTYEDQTVLRTGRCKLQRFLLSTVLFFMHHIVFCDILSGVTFFYLICFF